MRDIEKLLTEYKGLVARRGGPARDSLFVEDVIIFSSTARARASLTW